MKTIYLARHAKSSWKDLSLKDHERPLNKRGLRDGPFMAQKLYELFPDIDVFVSSHAVRAKKTAGYFADQYGIDASQVIEEKNLYHATTDGILEVIFGVSDVYNSVILFGHNPGFTDFANQFATQYIPNVPTCGIVKIDSDIKSWTDLHFGKGTVTSFIYPKKFT